MNVSPAATATPGAHGGPAKTGKGSDPLADFMAMLGQLGIGVEADGTLTTSTTASPNGPDNITAKLLAKLGKKIGDTAEGKKAEPSSDNPGEQVSDDASPDSAVTTLADLLNQIDPKAAQSTEPAKLDVAMLIAAVRSIATSEAMTKASPGADAAPASTAPVTATRGTPSIASLLVRTTRAADENVSAAPAPGTVQTAFSRLEALVAGKAGANAKDAAQPANDDAAADSTESTASRSGSSARLTELLARLADSPKPTTAQPQMPATPQAAAARPHTDPQMAAVAAAIQQAFGDDKPVKGTANHTADSAIAGIAPSTPGAVTASATANPNATADANQINVADSLTRHHLDIAKDSQWLDTLARDIARAAQHDTQLRFQLNPEHLGSLKVELVNGANGTSVKLTADTETARAILADAQPRLVAEARAQGLRISEAQVDLSGQGSAQRHAADTPVIVRTGNGAAAAEVESNVPASSGERYA